MGPWAISREMAKSLGCLDYYTGYPCTNNHTTIRRTTSGKCYECERISWEKVRRRRGKKVFQPNSAKQAAEILGEKYFQGEKCPRGHKGLRWTHNSACVECTIKASREFHKTEEGLAYSRQWRVENIDKVREHNRNVKARRKGADGSHTAKDIRDLLESQKFKCAECGVSVKKQKNRHIDHIMPLSRGGTNWAWNLQILCPQCNMAKGAKLPIEWAHSRGRLF